MEKKLLDGTYHFIKQRNRSKYPFEVYELDCTGKMPMPQEPLGHYSSIAEALEVFPLAIDETNDKWTYIHDMLDLQSVEGEWIVIKPPGRELDPSTNSRLKEKGKGGVTDLWTHPLVEGYIVFVSKLVVDESSWYVYPVFKKVLNSVYNLKILHEADIVPSPWIAAKTSKLWKFHKLTLLEKSIVSLAAENGTAYTGLHLAGNLESLLYFDDED